MVLVVVRQPGKHLKEGWQEDSILGTEMAMKAAGTVAAAAVRGTGQSVEKKGDGSN
jgi:hypothetical protein